LPRRSTPGAKGARVSGINTGTGTGIGMVMKTNLTPEEAILQHAIRGSWTAWFETFGRIEDKRGEEITPRANYLQERVDAVVSWLTARGLPVRMLVLKPRQKGSSTFTTAGLYMEGRKRPLNGVIIGGAHSQAENLYNKLKFYTRKDDFDWGTRSRVTNDRAEFGFPNGRETVIERKTARNPEVGRSATFQFVLGTEVARWSEEGVANAKSVLSGLLKTVAKKDGTFVILESTARGAAGDFYERWCEAMEFEEYQAAFEAGKDVSGRYIRVFAPWYEFEDSRDALTPQQTDAVLKGLGKVERYNSPDFGDEHEIMSRFGLTVDQMSWRRWAIDEECEKDPQIFEQDYPSTAETAFLRSGNKRFNAAGLRYLQDLAKKRVADYGYLDWQGVAMDSVTWRSVPEEESVVLKWEEPREGNRYLIAVDTMTGASQVTGDDPDCHSVLVLRRGYMENGLRWKPPAVVCRIKGPCRWDIDLIAEWVRRLHYYYRGAMIVPEVNNSGLALVELLKQHNVAIYEREVFAKLEKKFTKQLGWQTTHATRTMLIDNLAKAIREYDTDGDGVEVYDPRTVDELNAFIRKENGREEAMEGHHDDDVLALAIGLCTIDAAVAMRRKPRQIKLPRDLRRLEEMDSMDGGHGHTPGFD